MYTCRECEHPINQGTELCPYCGADLTAHVSEEESAPGKKRNWFVLAALWAMPLVALWGFLWFILPERKGESIRQAEAQAIAALREIGAALAADAEARGEFPATLEALGSARGREGGLTVREAAQRAQSAGYQLDYVTSQAGNVGAVRHFLLQARAGNYGFRSFVVDETGIIRATRENRAATLQDPTI